MSTVYVLIALAVIAYLIWHYRKTFAATPGDSWFTGFREWESLLFAKIVSGGSALWLAAEPVIRGLDHIWSDGSTQTVAGAILDKMVSHDQTAMIIMVIGLVFEKLRLLPGKTQEEPK